MFLQQAKSTWYAFVHIVLSRLVLTRSWANKVSSVSDIHMVWKNDSLVISSVKILAKTIPSDSYHVKQNVASEVRPYVHNSFPRNRQIVEILDTLKLTKNGPNLPQIRILP